MSCNHCIDPECLRGCPTNSYIKLDNGIIFHDDYVCIGCQYCTWNCPYEVPVFNPNRGIVTKCHMCVDKLEAGQTPACVQACPGGAIEIETVNVEQWVAEDMAKEGAIVLLAVTLLAGMAQVLIIFEEVIFYRHLDKGGLLYYQLNRTRTLLQEHFGSLKRFRIYTLITFALALPLFAILFVASGLTGVAIFTLLLSFAGALVSELAGRYLFYRTVVPLGLAGNFFAGNQRH